MAGDLLGDVLWASCGLYEQRSAFRHSWRFRRVLPSWTVETGELLMRAGSAPAQGPTALCAIIDGEPEIPDKAKRNRK
jgi:hypothetical protein